MISCVVVVVDYPILSYLIAAVFLKDLKMMLSSGSSSGVGQEN
jgi:hypothetical protein